MRIVCFTIEGKKKAQQLADCYADISQILYKGEGENPEISLKSYVEEAFLTREPLLFIGACGIAVRAIAPFVDSKLTDPPVLVMDEAGRYVIPILSSHLGGGGKLARELAALVGGEAVLTTASDVRGLFAADEFAGAQGFIIPHPEQVKSFAVAYRKSGRAKLLVQSPFVQVTADLPEGMELADAKTRGNEREDEADTLEKVPTLYLGIQEPDESDTLWLVPPGIYVGMGCKKGKTVDELHAFLKEELEQLGIPVQAVSILCSAELKKEEIGLCQLAERLGIPFCTYDKEELLAQKGDFIVSEFVRETVGVDNVCERSVMAAGAQALLLHKTSRDGMTLALGYKTKVVTAF